MAAEQLLHAGLYVVATPLGNLRDVTLRALDVMRGVSCIACEDTRVTRDLLRLLEVPPPTLLSVREHNERSAADTVVQRIAAGEAVAYMSDAGTPAISDPGARLVAAVRAAGQAVVPVPGVSAVTAALSVAGLESTAFNFHGFAPVGAGELRDFVAVLAAQTATGVFFESPHRAGKTLAALAEGLPPDRRVVVARELTKKFETVSAITAADLPAWLGDNESRLRGEFVIAVAGGEASAPSSSIDSRTLLKALLDELPPAKAAKLAARISGEPRDSLYALAESLKSR